MPMQDWWNVLSTPEEVERIADHMDHALHQLEIGEKACVSVLLCQKRSFVPNSTTFW